MSETRQGQFASYVDDRLAERNETVIEFAARSGLSPSAIFRWKRGARPDLEKARIAARAWDVPAMEVWIACGLISAEEAGATVAAPRSLEDIDDEQLAAEMVRRMREGRS